MLSLRKKVLKRIISLIVVVVLTVTAVYFLSNLPFQYGVYRWTPLSIGLLTMGVGLIISSFLYEFSEEKSVREK